MAVFWCGFSGDVFGPYMAAKSLIGRLSFNFPTRGASLACEREGLVPVVLLSLWERQLDLSATIILTNRLSAKNPSHLEDPLKVALMR